MSIVRKLYRKKELDRIEKRLSLFGISRHMTTDSFFNLRLLTSIIVFLLTWLISSQSVIIAIIVSIACYLSFTYFIIDQPLAKRIKKLEHEAYYYFEVLTLSLETDRNLEAALEIACTNLDSEIAKEFQDTLYKIKFGKTLKEALEDMRVRMPSDIINNIIMNIIHANLYGNSIIETMYHQLDFLREKQNADLEETIAKIPTKVSVISVLLFIPLMLLLILSPIIIDFISK